MQDGIVEPVSRGLHVRLRRAVLDHATSETRRTFAPVLHVGLPGEHEAAFEVRPDDVLDQALRVDIVSALVRRTHRRGSTPLVWLARPGDLAEVHDTDLAWLAATRATAGELGRHLPYVVVNRRAWRDPRTGVGRSWQRLRAR